MAGVAKRRVETRHPDEPVTGRPGEERWRTDYRERMRRTRVEFRDIEAEVPPRLSSPCPPDMIYATRCHQMAYFYTADYMDHPGVRLVRGRSLVIGGIGEHSWVELPGGVVFEAVLQRFYQAGPYYERAYAEAYFKFTPDAAVQIFVALTQAGYEPGWDWRRALRLPWIDPRHPVEVDVAYATSRLKAAGFEVPPRVQGRRRSRRVT